ncbi:MAG: anti-sigma factor family protein, partial [Butyricicoccus sp.]
MPDCEYFEELCSMALDGELSRAQKRELDAHLAECPACAAYLDDLKLIRTAWGDVKEPLPEALHEKIMSGVVEEARKKVAPPEKRKRRPPVFTMIAAAAACVMIAVSGAASDVFGGLKVERDSVSVAATGSADEEGAAMEDMPLTALNPAQEPAEDAQIVPRISESAGESDAGAGQKSGGSLYASPEAVPESMDEGSEPTLGAPSAFAARMTTEQNAAAGLAIAVPDELLTHGYGFCYVAVGNGNPPALEQATLIEKDGNLYYFKIENSMTVLEKLGALLQEDGYETALRSDVGVTI